MKQSKPKSRIKVFLQDFLEEWFKLAQPIPVLATLGDAGAFLESYALTCEDFVKENLGYCRKVLHKWTTVKENSATKVVMGKVVQGMSATYVLAVRERFNVRMTLLRRGSDGSFERHSSVGEEETSDCSIRAPPHVIGALAKHAVGRQLLLDADVVILYDANSA